MKLVKLSLVAAMAAGVFATTASAAPLEEVIKDVDVSGYTRLRYTHDRDAARDNSAAWNFRGVLDIKAKIDDNFFSVVGIRYNDSDNAHGGDVSTSRGSDGQDFDLYQAYFGYNIGGTTIQVGRQVLGTFFSADMYGDGIKVVNTDVEGLVLAALWMDSLEDDGDMTARKTVDALKADGTLPASFKGVADHNLYGVAAIGAYDPVSFQIWYAVLEDAANLFAVEVAAAFDIDENVMLGGRAQYGFSDLDSDYTNTGLLSDGEFFGIEAFTKAYGFDMNAGYVFFDADNDTTYSLVTLEDQGGFISPGEEVLDYTFFLGKNDYWFITAGYTFADYGVRVGVDYINGDQKFAGDKSDIEEWVARIDYAHNKNLKFKLWYSDYEIGDDDNKRVRFEAKYSF
ncbi:MAG: major outer membrane protein [Campylobacter sp.]|nr:major outer membrane protein [Campylobacter sp.]